MKTYSQFVKEASGGSPYQPYKPDANAPKKPTQPDEGFDKFRERFGLPAKPIKQAQLAPSKSILVGPNSEQLPHMDTRSPGQLLRNLQQQKKYYDSIGKNPPTV